MDPTLLIPAALATLALLTVGGGALMAIGPKAKEIPFKDLPPEILRHYLERGYQADDLTVFEYVWDQHYLVQQSVTTDAYRTRVSKELPWPDTWEKTESGDWIRI